MAGAALVPGNMTPVAEANVRHDPEAADLVFGAAWDMVMVGLDVTMEHVFDDADRRALLASDRPVAVAIGQMMDAYIDFYRPVFGRPCTALHDPLAAAIACGTVDVESAPVVRVVVDTTDGPGRGQTICDLRGRFRGFPVQDGAHCTVVLTLTAPFAPELLRRILSV